MDNPILYILCGCAGCGKSTWAKKFFYSTMCVEWISRDDIRFEMLKDGEDYFAHEEEVFSKFVKQIQSCLMNDYDVIADATHLNVKSRKKLLNAIGDNIEYNIIYVYFNTPFEICCGRNEKREGRARVPDKIMQSMWNSMQKPAMTEDSRCIGLILMKGY